MHLKRFLFYKQKWLYLHVHIFVFCLLIAFVRITYLKLNTTMSKSFLQGLPYKIFGDWNTSMSKKKYEKIGILGKHVFYILLYISYHHTSDKKYQKDLSEKIALILQLRLSWMAKSLRLLWNWKFFSWFSWNNSWKKIITHSNKYAMK